MLDPYTCVLLGVDDQLNVKLLRAALRNPPPRLAVGNATPEAEAFIRSANDATGDGAAFELAQQGSVVPTGAHAVVFDGRRAPVKTLPSSETASPQLDEVMLAMRRASIAPEPQARKIIRAT